MSEEERTTRDGAGGDGGDGTPADATPDPEVAAAMQPGPLDQALVETQTCIVELERRVEELKREVAGEREAATDYMQRWQRAQADFANFKRRAQQEQEQQQRLAGAQALAGVLPALDSLERAFATLPPELRHYTWIDGIGLVHLQLHSALQAAGIKPIAVEPGAAFDPRLQQAIGDVATRDVPVGHVAAVVQQGYEVHGIMLRPVLVQLARAPEAGETGEAIHLGQARQAGEVGPGSSGGEASGGEASGQGPAP
jgi:molecular chaperone GrpE